MKKILFSALILLASCTKEYSPQLSNEIKVSITGQQYTTTVNGSTIQAWVLRVALSKPAPEDLRIVYSFSDSQTSGMTVSQFISKGSDETIFNTQYRASGSFSSPKLIRVDGADQYQFSLK